MDETRSTFPEADPSLHSLSQIRHLLRVEFSRAQRYGYPVACAMLAVDRLGPLRDRHGFEVKEEILDGVVRMLRANTRSCDYLGRLVDERLMAVLPHTGPEGAQVVAERLVGLARGLEVRSRGERVPVSVSVGVSHFQGANALFFDQLLDAAESALAEAIAAGGDRAVRRDPVAG